MENKRKGKNCPNFSNCKNLGNSNQFTRGISHSSINSCPLIHLFHSSEINVIKESSERAFSFEDSQTRKSKHSKVENDSETKKKETNEEDDEIIFIETKKGPVFNKNAFSFNKEKILKTEKEEIVLYTTPSPTYYNPNYENVFKTNQRTIWKDEDSDVQNIQIQILKNVSRNDWEKPVNEEDPFKKERFLSQYDEWESKHFLSDYIELTRRENENTEQIAFTSSQMNESKGWPVDSFKKEDDFIFQMSPTTYGNFFGRERLNATNPTEDFNQLSQTSRVEFEKSSFRNYFTQ